MIGGLNKGVFYRSFLALGFCMMSISVVGCSGGNSDVAAVTGTLTVNGKPIEKARVTFYPVEGRASAAFTDADGKYDLIYTVKQNGALIGRHVVTVTTAVQESMDYSTGEIEDNGGVSPRREMLPMKYRDRQKTDLTATVEKGPNVIDFALKTK